MILFRADANRRIGMGHIMRCLSLADAATALFPDREIRFVLADDSVSDLIRNRGYESFILHSAYDAMEAETENWPEIKPEMIIVDSYFVTPAYFRALRQKTEKLVYIDDLAAFPYPVDVLVNYNAYGPYMDYKRLYNGCDEPEYILGPVYAPLRKMFRGMEKKKQPEEIRNILISTGGSDELHIAVTLLSEISKSYTGNAVFHFLLGALNTDKERIRNLSAGKTHIALHENVTDMRGLIERMDLAVSAAGSTLYEICACGVPLITYVQADNQIAGATAFDKLGLAVNLGDIREEGSAGDTVISGGKLRPGAAGLILDAVEDLGRKYEKRVEIGSHMQELIDGFGADRLVKRMLK